MTESEAEQILARLREIIIDAAPDARLVEKYGGEVIAPEPDNDKSFVGGIFGYKNHVTMEFSNGAEFDDPEGLLEGEGKKRRHLKFISVEDVDAGIIKGFLDQALK